MRLTAWAKSVGALAIVLIGLSAMLYSLARTYRYRQIDERLEAALDVLSATAEGIPNGVEWEAKGRVVSLEPPPGGEQLVWRVGDESGRTIAARGFGRVLLEAVAWRVRERRIPTNVRILIRADKGHHDDDKRDRLNPFIQLSVALPLAPVEESLQRLLISLGGLSLAVWLTAAFLVGRSRRPYSHPPQNHFSAKNP